jgi:hypothetical protein
MEFCLMLEVLNPFFLWPIGVALGGLLFFKIAKHCWRVDPVPRAFEARSKVIRPAWPAANVPRPARAAWPSRPAEAQRILAGNEPVWSIPSGNVNPTRREPRVMVSIRVIGEDDAVALASGEAEFELDAMMPVRICGARGTDELLGRSLILATSLRPDVGYDKQFDAIIDRQEMDPGVAGPDGDGRRRVRAPTANNLGG